MPAGYSGTPLPQKLGIKPGTHIFLDGAPPSVLKELGFSRSPKSSNSKPLDFSLMFVKSQAELRKKFAEVVPRLAPAGIFWIAWPKKTSGVATDLNENVVREIGLAAGVVDVKVCAIDEIWSGLKFVFRLKDRPKR